MRSAHFHCDRYALFHGVKRDENVIAPAGRNNYDVHSAVHERLVIGRAERLGIAVSGDARRGFFHAILVNIAKRCNYHFVVDEHVSHKSVSALSEPYKTYSEFVFHFVYPFFV